MSSELGERLDRLAEARRLIEYGDEPVPMSELFGPHDAGSTIEIVDHLLAPRESTVMPSRTLFPDKERIDELREVPTRALASRPRPAGVYYRRSAKGARR